MSSIVIVNYGMGNLRSVYNRICGLGVTCSITSDLNEINNADKIILPGVGHFEAAMRNLTKLQLVNILQKKVQNDMTPILGICLGAQLFAVRSEEGNCNGLGWIDANVVKFQIKDTRKYKIPHIGWNKVSVNSNYGLDYSMFNSEYFYFVHGYHFSCNDKSDVWMTTHYEYEFASAVRKGHIWGTQFHPEKSHEIGKKLLMQFITK